MKAIINGKIILKDEIIEDKAVVFGDVISEIVSNDAIPENAEIIDAKGGYVAPGLIDLHIHGYLGKDVCDASAESIRTMAGGIIKNGVTSFLPTTMTVSMDTIKKSLEVIRNLKEESKSWDGAEILGAHAEGPFISAAKKGAQEECHILKPDAEFINKYKDVISIITLAPEEDEDFSEIKKVSGDVVVSMGHTSADYETAVRSTKAGVRHVTHLFNAMTPVMHRAPGVVIAAMNSDVSCELIVDKYHVAPAFYDLVWKLKGRKLCFITDCLPAGGLPEGEHTLGGQKITYDGKVCRLSDGTIAGSVLKLSDGVFNVYKNSSIPLHECVNCASLNPATVLGIDDKKGSIDKGKDADIIITDEEFNVKMTIKKGQIKYMA